MDLEGVLDGFVQVEGETRTNFSVEDDTEMPPTTFNQRGPTISEEEWDRLKVKVETLSPKAEWVSFGGSLPPGVETDAFYELALLARKGGSKIVLDADGPALAEGIKANPDFIKPNAAEAGRLIGRPAENVADVIEITQELYERFGGGARHVVISRGAQGAIMTCKDGTFHGESPHVHPRSTIGSGDSMIAGMLWALGEGKTSEEALRWGLSAGAATALTDGCAIGDKATIDLLFPEAKVSML